MPMLSVYSVQQYDPTHTLSLRNQFAREMNARFKKIIKLINKAIIDEDVLALKPRVMIMQEGTPGDRAFEGKRSGEKVTAFMEWLEEQVRIGVLDVVVSMQLGQAIEQSWMNKYIMSAYQRGILRGRQELINKGHQAPPINQIGGVSAVFNTPFHVDRVGLIYTRAYNDLKGITDAMDTQISRILAQGMAEGRNPREMARLLTRTITGPAGDLSLTDTLGRFIPAKRRAEMLARTEVIRAHHVATIQEYRNWGVEGVTVKAEWMTAEDDRVCPECLALEHQVFELDVIESMIPLHPQCRCVALPLDVTEET